jgi:hypothetical protein
LIHRIRGGGIVTLPFKATYVIWPLVGLLAWAAGAPWPVAVVWAVGYLIWILPAWTIFLTRAVGAAIPAGQVVGSGLDVKLVNALSFGNPDVACLVRAALFLAPLVAGLVALDVYADAGPVYDVVPLLLIVAAFLPAYLIGYKARPTNMASAAEWIVGASWGAAMTGMLLLA